MKAIAVFPKTKEVKLVDCPEPAIRRPTEVKIKIMEVGICGTDREIWDFKYGTPPPGSDYLITGHEAIGRVTETGRDVKTVKVGDYVVPTVRRGCPERCASCAAFRPDFCYTGHFTERGIKGAHGYMTETIVEDEKYLNAVPDRLSDVGVLLEPLTITEKALAEAFLIQRRLPSENAALRNALVLGAGPVGVLGTMALLNRGLKVTAVAHHKKPNAKASLLSGLGVEYLSTEEKDPGQIADAVGQIDLILEATGAPKVAFDFLQVLGINGIFIFTGVPGLSKDIPLDTSGLMRNLVLKNQIVLGTVNASKSAFENGLADLQSFVDKWPGQIRGLVTDRIPLVRFQEVFVTRREDEMKTVLLP